MIIKLTNDQLKKVKGKDGIPPPGVNCHSDCSCRLKFPEEATGMFVFEYYGNNEN